MCAFVCVYFNCGLSCEDIFVHKHDDNMDDGVPFSDEKRTTCANVFYKLKRMTFKFWSYNNKSKNNTNNNNIVQTNEKLKVTQYNRKI